MSEGLAAVILHPLHFPDAFPFRSLTFLSETGVINIGRASKREEKDMIPGFRNAWFESRIMSRNHASLTVSLMDKTVYVRDNNSMHGTWVNDKKIPSGCDVAICTNDVLTFGTEITRGPETFVPVRMRCEHRWLSEGKDESMLKTPLPQGPNSFCVPEDDDDAPDVVQETLLVGGFPTGACRVDDLNIGPSLDDRSSAASTPLSENPDDGGASVAQFIPEENDLEKDEGSHHTADVLSYSTAGPTGSSGDETAQFRPSTPLTGVKVSKRADYPGSYSPLNAWLDCDEAAAARHTPGESDMEDYNSSRRVTDAINCSARDSTGSGSDETPQVRSPVPLAGVKRFKGTECIDSCYNGSERDNKPVSFHESDDITRGHDFWAACDDTNEFLNRTLHPVVSQKPLDAQNNIDSLDKTFIPKDRKTTHVEQAEAVEVECTSVKTSDPKPAQRRAHTEKDAEGEPAMLAADTSERSVLEDSPVFDPLGQYWPALLKHGTLKQPTVSEGERVRYSSHSQAVPSPALDNSRPSRNLSCTVDDTSVYREPGKPLNGTIGIKLPYSARRETHMTVGDEVTVLRESGSLKRKTAEMSSESLVDESDTTEISVVAMDTNQVSFSQDAQPRVFDEGAKMFDSHLMNLESIDGDSSALPRGQPPRKRLNTGRNQYAGSFASHAVTAIAGAVLGGLGTIVALASLPPGYFN